MFLINSIISEFNGWTRINLMSSTKFLFHILHLHQKSTDSEQTNQHWRGISSPGTWTEQMHSMQFQQRSVNATEWRWWRFQPSSCFIYSTNEAVPCQLANDWWWTRARGRRWYSTRIPEILGEQRRIQKRFDEKIIEIWQWCKQVKFAIRPLIRDTTQWSEVKQTRGRQLRRRHPFLKRATLKCVYSSIPADWHLLTGRSHFKSTEEKCSQPGHISVSEDVDDRRDWLIFINKRKIMKRCRRRQQQQQQQQRKLVS